MEYQLAEQRWDDDPDTLTLEEWRSETTSMTQWIDHVNEECSHLIVERDNESLKTAELEIKVHT